MKQEVITHYGNRLKIKSKRVYRKSLKTIVKSKFAVIATSNITIHYTKEILMQWKVFIKHEDYNRFRKPTNYDY